MKGALSEAHDLLMAKAHLFEQTEFASEASAEHGGIVGGYAERYASMKKTWQRMIRETRVGTAEVLRQGSGAQVARGTDLQADQSLRKQGHKVWISCGRDAVADTLSAENFDSVAHRLRSSDFTGMDEPAQTVRGSVIVYLTKFGCG